MSLESVSSVSTVILIQQVKIEEMFHIQQDSFSL